MTSKFKLKINLSLLSESHVRRQKLSDQVRNRSHPKNKSLSRSPKSRKMFKPSELIKSVKGKLAKKLVFLLEGLVSAKIRSKFRPGS